MNRLNLQRLQNLCLEISELEYQVSFDTQAEITPAFRELILILQEHVPEAHSIEWTTDSNELEFILNTAIDQEQQNLLDKLKSIIPNLKAISILAFGNQTSMSLDIKTGHIVKEEYV